MIVAAAAISIAIAAAAVAIAVVAARASNSCSKINTSSAAFSMHECIMYTVLELT